MFRLSKTRSYCVPVVRRTLDILELLYRHNSPLKTNEISDLTRIPQSTTYRILRTLMERGYVLQNVDGQFSVRSSTAAKIIPIMKEDPSGSLCLALNSDANLTADQIVETLLAFLQILRHSTKLQPIRKDCEPAIKRRERGAMGG